MPRYNIAATFEKVDGFDDIYLFLLSQSTYELVNSLFEQAEWDVKDQASRSLYTKASREITIMANLQDLINVLQASNELHAALNECVCALNIGTDVARYDLPPDFLGFNPDYVPGAEFNSQEGIPEPIVSQGYTSWELYQEYTCKAVELVRRSAVIMTEHILRVMDTPAIVLTMLAAVIGSVLAILGVVALPTIAMGAALFVPLGAALISVGQTGAEAVRDYLADPTSEVWANIACIVKSSPNSAYATAAILSYIESSAPSAAYAVLRFYPWESWVNQVYLGENTEGAPLDVTGLTSLCPEGCGQSSGQELMEDPEIDDSSLSKWYMWEDPNVPSCDQMPQWDSGRAMVSDNCSGTRHHFTSNIVVILADLSSVLDVNWSMYRNGSAPGAWSELRISRIETGAVEFTANWHNRTGLWVSSGEWTPLFTGAYRVSIITDGSVGSYFERVSIRR